MKVLYDSTQIRRQVRAVMERGQGRRIALVAFVGADAPKFLPDPRGVQVVCWPKAGGTNPDGVRALIRGGAKVFFSDRLHMKLFGSEKGGCVVGSANLTENALGDHGLRELCVLLPSDAVDLDAVLRPIRRRPVTAESLRRLDREHALFLARNPADQPSDRRNGHSFADWYGSPHRREWRLEWWEEPYNGVSEVAQQKARTEYGVREVQQSIATERGRIRPGDWTLLVSLKSGRHASPRWVYCDFVTRVPKHDRGYDPSYSYEVAQVHPLRKYGPPPFRIDSALRTAIDEAITSYGADRIRRSRTTVPTPEFVRNVSRTYRRTAGM